MQALTYPRHFIRFLGTAGTRFIMLSQRRASGGIWFSYGNCKGVIDPGPGSLVQICNAKPALLPTDIDTLILTHRHIDHSCDLNVLAEGMTLRSRAKTGQVLLTEDSIDTCDPVLMKYLQEKVERTHRHGDGKITSLSEDVSVESVVHAHHGVQCYGIIFRCKGLPTWGIISDSAALPHFPQRYRECDMLVVNATLHLPWSRLDHMSVPDVASLLQVLHPHTAVLTHMGHFLLETGPEKIASSLATPRTNVVAANDGMTIDLTRQFQHTDH